jgi:hypothetical protein
MIQYPVAVAQVLKLEGKIFFPSFPASLFKIISVSIWQIVDLVSSGFLFQIQ